MVYCSLGLCADCIVWGGCLVVGLCFVKRVFDLLLSLGLSDVACVLLFSAGLFAIVYSVGVAVYWHFRLLVCDFGCG